MTKSIKYIFIGALLLLVSLACNITSDPPDPITPSIPSSDENGGGITTETAPTLSLTVTNNSSRTVCSLYLTEHDATEWGAERLGTDVLIAGSSFGLDVIDGDYRMRANDCDGALIAEYSDFEVNGSTDISIEDKTVEHSIAAGGDPGTLTIVNNSSQDVCYVHISSTEATSWGSDWLGENTILDSGETETIIAGAGLWDLQVSDCDGDALAEQYDIDLSATGQTWTLN